MPESLHAGHLLAGRYRLDDLLAESAGGRFWRAYDQVLHRPVAVHLIPKADERAEGLMEAARQTAPHHDRRILRVLDADEADQCCYVVNEWGQGISLDAMLATTGPLQPRRAAWVASEIADSLARAHDAGLHHGRMVPENVLIDLNGEVRLIGFAVDAALHGLPPGREQADLVDTAAVLYAAMTGKWAGISSSSLPAAPTEGGQVLRPRRVRAGIPRPLDDLCDQVINSDGGSSRSNADLSAMAGIATTLVDFVGDPSGLSGPDSWSDHQPASTETQLWSAPSVTPASQAVPAAAPTSATPLEVPVPTPEPRLAVAAVAAPAVDSAVDAAVDAAANPVTHPAPDPATGAAATPGVADESEMPTQAGIPVFDEDNTVGWIQTRSANPPSPPPLEDADAKPLFAPEPPDGQPVRRARPGSTAAQAGDYWPWDSTGTSAGSAVPAPAETSDVDHDIPGRRWFRLALLIGVILLALVGAVTAHQLSAGNDGGTNTGADPRTTEPSPAAPTPFTDLTAVDFDPQGDAPQEENPDQVPLALDGDPGTAWRTVTYRQNLGRPSGLKDGVGLQVDLGATKGVREIDVTTLGGPTELSVFVTSTAPTGVEKPKLTPVGTASGDGVLKVALDEAVSGRYVTVWLTSLPAVDGGYQGAIAEVTIKG